MSYGLDSLKNTLAPVLVVLACSILPSVSFAQVDDSDLVRPSSLRVVFRGLRNSNGKVLVQLFRSERGFPADARQAFQRVVLDVQSGVPAVADFVNLAPGLYAIAAVHDENNNGKMDTNWMGIPQEGLAISRDARGRFGPPSFEDAAFQLSQDLDIAINVVYF